MKKKFVVILSFLLVFSLIAVACSSSQKPVNQEASDTKADEEKVSEKVVEIEIGYVTTPNEKDPYHIAAANFKKHVEEMTDGQVKVTLFPNGQLGQEREMIEGIQLGIVDGGVITNAYLSGFQPKLQLFDLPFLFSSHEEAHKIIDSEVGDALLESLESIGIKGLGFAEGGFRNMMNSVRPIRTLEDAKGIKFRSMENPLYMGMFKAIGANPTPLSWGEVYTANQLGTVEGLECPISVYDQSKLYEVTDYVSLTRHTYSPLVISISMEKWNEIPEDLQPIVIEATKLAIDEQRETNAENLQILIKELEEKGIEVNELENPQEFREVSLPLYKEFEDQIGKDLIEKSLDMLK